MFRYSNIDYIMNLGINEGVLLINKAIEEKRKRKHWEMWLARYPYMDKENYTSFEDFHDSLCGNNISTISKEEALRKAEEIEKKAREKGGI